MKKIIIDTGKQLPKANIGDFLELKQNRKMLVEKPIMNQSKKQGTVIYGRHALNIIMGVPYERETYDFDIYSKKPLAHAIQLEQSIDKGTNSNLAFIERTYYLKDGRKYPLVRVKIRPYETNEADYNKMPENIQFTKVKGIRVEKLNPAEKKYKKMIKQGEIRRMPKALFDLNDIQTFKMIKGRY